MATTRLKTAPEPANANTPVVALRENSIITLAQHGVLTADQVAAAWRFRRSYELVRDIRTSELDEIRGQRRPSGMAEKKIAAVAELKIAKRYLGAHGYALVSTICGEGFHVRDIYMTRRERDTATDLLRIHLSGLATLFPH